MSISPTLRSVITKDFENKVKKFDNEDVKEGSVVLLGDSMFDYFDHKKYLKGNIVNRGIAGDTSKGVLKRLEQIYKIKPKVVLLHIGSNDIVRYEEECIDLVRRILDIKYKLETNIPEVRVHVLSLSPVLRDSVKTNKSFMKHRTNEIIQEINEELNIYTDIIDVNGCLTDDKTGSLKESFTTDGLHLTDLGYKWFSKHIAKNIKEVDLI